MRQTKKKSPWGRGSLYLNGGGEFLLRYYTGTGTHRKRKVVPTGCRNKTAARVFARQHLAASELREPRTQVDRSDDLRYEEAIELLVKRRILKGKSTRIRTKHLEHFRGLRWSDITRPDVMAVVEKMREKGLTESTIRSTVDTLAGAQKAAKIAERLAVYNFINLVDLTEDSVIVRELMWKDEQFEAVRSNLPAELQGLFHFAFLTSWRFSEISELNFEHWDRENGIINTPTLLTKENLTAKEKKQRFFPYRDFMPQVGVLLERQAAAAAVQGLDTTGPQPLWFVLQGQGPRGQGSRAKPGTRITYQGMMGQLRKAMKVVGIPYGHKKEGGLVFHDLRHSACARLEKSGIPWALVSEITGHRSRGQNDAYARSVIHDGDFWKVAGVKVQEHVPSIGEV